ncbi:MAG: CRISPR-associated protein Cas5 [Puniceicoccales bacterium]|jgi:CRISPR system Cascade subunit CasD|nr:CRISPR-associated protein Cas5 [Puniceicoccales bacterium]
MDEAGLLALRFKSPLQSWGTDAKFPYVRSTQTMPSKSGVIGMICAADGLDKYDPDGGGREAEQIQKLRKLSYEFWQIAPCPDENLDGKRLEQQKARPQILFEYQTIGGGYSRDEASRPWEKCCIPVKASDGKPRDEDGQALPYWRHYLQDCDFVAIIGGNRSTLDRIGAVLENPKWGIWFGTKCCLPSTPLVERIFSSKAELEEEWKNGTHIIFRHARSRKEENGCHRRIRCHRTTNDFSSTSTRWADEPLSFRDRSYAIRSIGEEFFP